jgi:hypothetical protein
VFQVNSVARRIGAKLEDRDRAKLMVCNNNNNNNNNNKPPETETGDYHARTAITATLRKSLKDLMNDSQMLRQSVMDGYRDAIESRYTSECNSLLKLLLLSTARKLSFGCSENLREFHKDL